METIQKIIAYIYIEFSKCSKLHIFPGRKAYVLKILCGIAQVIKTIEFIIPLFLAFYLLMYGERLLFLHYILQSE